jgi:hypothetical protein
MSRTGLHTVSASLCFMFNFDFDSNYWLLTYPESPGRESVFRESEVRVRLGADYKDGDDPHYGDPQLLALQGTRPEMLALVYFPVKLMPPTPTGSSLLYSRPVKLDS